MFVPMAAPLTDRLHHEESVSWQCSSEVMFLQPLVGNIWMSLTDFIGVVDIT